MEKAQELLSQSWDLIITYGGRLVLAVIVLIIGLSVIKRISNTFRKTMTKREVDASLVPFLSSLINAALKVMLIISIAGMVGIEMTSFVAVLGAAGLAVGLALQGSLSNFAGGVLILILKPFKVGDFIEGAGVSGTVREIQIFYTFLTTPTGQEIMVPNGSLSNNSIVNYSYNSTRRLDMTFGIGYGDDIDKAKAILHEIAGAENRFLEDKGVTIFVEALADSSVNIRLRAWTTNGDYWDVLNGLNEKVKKAFDGAGVGIPFPQMDLHLVEDRTK
ncbi:mechanosensitive ion channel family protein [Croceimicrobium hydrocarbonivorans]|uniref:Mechanosensitive ion channel n=1 Tax=Croceimicrobium hydrocarbonivorans TaxID=2761580 RepID=A0A7H0VAR4_9FLAO|nr:mechanosensitive ion channel domain-containing protein [Croceimicrobium hydrocarbonivorans]QNR22812.1 mechanosensitive ion channel [Croceimicrobium hydrocarbonivorans]